VPSIALSSTGALELVSTVIHTERDRLELLDVEMVAKAVGFVRTLVGDARLGAGRGPRT
jgi:hypothetical protein